MDGNATNVLQIRWQSVSYVLIDKISTVSCDLFAEVSAQLVHAKASTDKTLPFGGINLIVFGDFYQFPPVGGKALYADSMLTIPKELTYHDLSEKTNLKLAGRSLFLQVDCVFFLHQQMRQAGDLRYDCKLI